MFRVPDNDVDHAAFAEPGVGDLWPDRPSRHSTQPCDYGELCVLCVDEPVEVTTARARKQLDADVESARKRPERAHLDAFKVAPFDAGDGGVRDVGGSSKVALAPASPNSRGTKDGAEPLVVHGANDGAGGLSVDHLDEMVAIPYECSNQRTRRGLSVDRQAGRGDNPRDRVENAPVGCG